jgi:hypothetical protein
LFLTSGRNVEGVVEGMPWVILAPQITAAIVIKMMSSIYVQN